MCPLSADCPLLNFRAKASIWAAVQGGWICSRPQQHCPPLVTIDSRCQEEENQCNKHKQQVSGKSTTRLRKRSR